jgi:hypothetical protein
MKEKDKKYTRKQAESLSRGIKHNINFQEKSLGKKCRIIASSTNPEGNQYLYGIFSWDGKKDDEETVVTLAHFDTNIQHFLATK